MPYVPIFSSEVDRVDEIHLRTECVVEWSKLCPVHGLFQSGSGGHNDCSTTHSVCSCISSTRSTTQLKRECPTPITSRGTQPLRLWEAINPYCWKPCSVGIDPIAGNWEMVPTTFSGFWLCSHQNIITHEIDHSFLVEVAITLKIAMQIVCDNVK